MSVVRLMTWNINGAMGRNPNFDPSAVVALIQRHKPDVVALQEIDSRRRTVAGDNPFDLLREALGCHGVDAYAITTPDGAYGQGLYSRWPMERSSVHDISFPEREPRRAICTDVHLPTGPLRVIATHLGLSFHERRAQCLKILSLIGDGRRPTVAMGDFNDWLWGTSVTGKLKKALGRCTAHRTFPSQFPLIKLDRIFVSRQVNLIGSHVDAKACLLSDHLPVIASLEVGSRS
jgi:endonuclease/exonuclease/phosphatase family metal-dependent hydrolase